MLLYQLLKYYCLNSFFSIFVTCFEVVVYTEPNFKGNGTILNVNDCLPTLQDELRGNILSIETFGNCVILFKEEKCNSSLILKIETNDIKASSDLSKYRLIPYDDIFLSIGKCHECLIQPGVGNWPHVENYYFLMANDIKMMAGSRWRFDSSEFTSINRTNTCGDIPSRILNTSNPVINVFRGCVQFYSNSDCTGDDIQLLDSYDTRTLTDRGYLYFPRSFSHCNSKCVKTQVLKSKGRILLSDHPNFSGFRLSYASGDVSDVPADLVNLRKCYNIILKNNSRVNSVAGYGVCVVLFTNRDCHRYPHIGRPKIFNQSSLDITHNIFFTRPISLRSVILCSEILKSESYSATLGVSTPPIEEILEITLFESKGFQGASKVFRTFTCQNLGGSLVSFNSMDTRDNCIVLYTDYNCSVGNGEILFPRSPVLADLSLLITREEMRSVRKCVASDHDQDGNTAFIFRMKNSNPGVTTWTFDSTNLDKNTCWEIPFYFRAPGMESIVIHQGCVQVYADTNCSPYAQSVRIRPYFDATDLEKWSFPTIRSFSGCNSSLSRKSLWEVDQPYWRLYHADGIVILFRSGITKAYSSVTSCLNLETNSNDPGQLVSAKRFCVVYYNQQNCHMIPYNIKPLVVNTTDAETVMITNLTSHPLWTDPKYTPRSLTSCDEFLSSQSPNGRNLGNDSANPNKASESTTIFIYIGLTVFVTAALGGAVFFLFLRYYASKMKLSDDEIATFYNGSNSVSANTDDSIQNMAINREYEILPKDFIYTHSEDNSLIVLGSGAFGVVAQGTLHTGFDESTGLPITRKVAIKTPRVGVTVEQIRSLLAEIKINMFVGRHEHIVEFLGFCIADIQRGKISIILELCENGSVLKFIRANATQFGVSLRSEDEFSANYQNMSTFRKTTLVRWCKEIADGMDHLAGNKVLHGDLAARNCLLDAQLSIKITDFGLSRKLYDYGNYVKKGKALLPWRWMALESLKTLQFSVKSDIWSYGVTCWEIYSLGDQPYPMVTWNDSFIQNLAEGFRLSRPINCPDECYGWMMSCWEAEPERRPDFSQISTIIGQHLAEIMID